MNGKFCPLHGTYYGQVCVVCSEQGPRTEGLQQSESILQEAQRLTHGPRGADYGPPLDDYNRTAALVSTLLQHKLKEPISAHEMALAMCCVKLSREMNAPKRDNMTDLAGYAWVAQEIKDETTRRDKV